MQRWEVLYIYFVSSKLMFHVALTSVPYFFHHDEMHVLS